MRRRTFVAGVGWSLVALKFGLLAGCGNGRDTILDIAPDADGARKALEEYLAGLEGVESAGPDCLIQAGSKEPVGDLLQRLRESGQKDLQQALEAAIVSDFTVGRVVELEGWQLSVTECLVAAAAARIRGLESPLAKIDRDVELGEIVPIEDWGPRETRENQVFNPQPGDRAALWIRADGPVPDGVKVVIGGEVQETGVDDGLITCILDSDLTEQLISAPALHRVFLLHEDAGKIQPVGQLQVREAAPPATLEDGSQSTVFCEVERWGPARAPAGSAFNEQPDGNAAFWVRIGCAPSTARLVLDGTPLPTHVGTGMVTARVPHYEDLDQGSRKLVIEDTDTGERVLVGEFSSQ